MLETNRVCGVNQSNFHIFYELLDRASSHLLEKIRLDALINYEVSIFILLLVKLVHNYPFLWIIEQFNLLISWLQYLPDKNSDFKSFRNSTNFDFINTNLDNLGISENDKISIYLVLSAILNLENIKFESNGLDNERCYITNESQKFSNNAAFCLNVDRCELEDALISRSREFAKQTIK